MRQFILTIGTLVALLVSCWELYSGISAIIKNELVESLTHIFVSLPIMLSVMIVFDYVNSQLHVEYRKFRTSLARKKGTQVDIFSPTSTEVDDTPWENDSSHTGKH